MSSILPALCVSLYQLKRSLNNWRQILYLLTHSHLKPIARCVFLAELLVGFACFFCRVGSRGSNAACLTSDSVSFCVSWQLELNSI